MVKHALIAGALMLALASSATSAEKHTQAERDQLYADCDPEKLTEKTLADDVADHFCLMRSLDARRNMCMRALALLDEILASYASSDKPADASVAMPPAPSAGGEPTHEVKTPWYGKDYEHPPTTLKEAIAAEKEIDPDSQGWSMNSKDPSVCRTLQLVGVSCDYNTRLVLSLFLTINGKGLYNKDVAFHADDGMDGMPNDGFVGQQEQNALLAAAVRRNAKLFKDGDLSAEDVKNSWVRPPLAKLKPPLLPTPVPVMPKSP